MENEYTPAEDAFTEWISVRSCREMEEEGGTYGIARRAFLAGHEAGIQYGLLNYLSPE